MVPVGLFVLALDKLEGVWPLSPLQSSGFVGVQDDVRVGEVGKCDVNDSIIGNVFSSDNSKSRGHSGQDGRDSFQ